MKILARLRQCTIAATAAAMLMTSSLSHAGRSEIVYFHTDANGSPTVAFNANGEICWAETYSPYGEKLDNEDKLEPTEGCGLLAPTDIGYTGHVQDSSGLVYAQQRYYDPQIGRFMSTDPVRPHAGDPRYFGRYHYAANNPYKYTDPTGELLFLGALPAITSTTAGTGLIGLGVGGTLLGIGLHEGWDPIGALLNVFNESSEDEEKPRGRNNRPIDEPVDLEEDLAGQEIAGGFIDNPPEEGEYSGKLGDPRYDPETGTHTKRRGHHVHPDGTITEVHADQDVVTGELSDVKFKDAPDNNKSRGSQ